MGNKVQDELEHFHGHINQQHTNIQFTVEQEKDCKLPFLSVQVIRSPEGLYTCVYRKPTHTDRYIPFHSYHHQRTLTGVLMWMRDGALQICSNLTRESEIRRPKEVFPRPAPSSWPSLTGLLLGVEYCQQHRQPRPSSVPR